AQLGDGLVHLVTGQLAALAGLGALGHLDLQFLGVDQIVCGDAEARRGHLLDRAVLGVAVGGRDEALRVLAALAGVALPVDAVHGARQGLVGLLADRAKGHGAGREALYELLRRVASCWRRSVASAISWLAMRSLREAVPVTEPSTSSWLRPMASKICAPQYDCTVEMPIFEKIFSRPLLMALINLVCAVAASSPSGR